MNNDKDKRIKTAALYLGLPVSPLIATSLSEALFGSAGVVVPCKFV